MPTIPHGYYVTTDPKTGAKKANYNTGPAYEVADPSRPPVSGPTSPIPTATTPVKTVSTPSAIQSSQPSIGTKATNTALAVATSSNPLAAVVKVGAPIVLNALFGDKPSPSETFGFNNSPDNGVKITEFIPGNNPGTVLGEKDPNYYAPKFRLSTGEVIDAANAIYNQQGGAYGTIVKGAGDINKYGQSLVGSNYNSGGHLEAVNESERAARAEGYEGAFGIKNAEGKGGYVLWKEGKADKYGNPIAATPPPQSVLEQPTPQPSSPSSSPSLPSVFDTPAPTRQSVLDQAVSDVKQPTDPQKGYSGTIKSRPESLLDEDVEKEQEDLLGSGTVRVRGLGKKIRAYLGESMYGG